MSRFVLFSTDCCHLCDQAIALIEPIATDLNVLIEVIDIAESEGLLEKYGLSIPVLANVDANIELNWPFNSADVKKILKN